MAEVRLSFEAIGTHWVIDISQLPSEVSEQAVFTSINRCIQDYDAVYSRFRSDSLITQISHSAGTYTLPPDGDELIDLYFSLYQETDGKFTPMIGKTMVEAGYDAEYSLKPQALTSVPNLFEVVSYQSPQLKVSQPVLLDFGAGGKGHLIDLVGAVLQDLGCTEFCIDAGGDILHKTAVGKTLQIGLEHPDNLSQVIGVLSLSNRSICGSAGNRRKWANFHHIIDPDTLRSPEHIAGTWVVADSTLLADALATALYFAPAGELQKRYTFEYCILYTDYTIEGSPEFPAQFFTGDEE